MSHLKDKYINPLTDFGFKKLFGTEPNKALLIDFLNQLLPARHQIKDLTYAKNEQLGLLQIDRKAIFDLYCVALSGERFIVEVQKAKQNFFKDRSVFYASFPIQEQAQKGDWNYQLDPVYTIGILDFIFEEHRQSEELLHVIELKNQHGELFFDKLKFIYIELPKFQKQADELTSQFDKWLYIFRYLSQLQNRPKQLQEKVFKQLFEAAEIAKFNPKERQAYEASLKYYRDLKNVTDTAWEEGREEGRAEGREEGRKEGREKGIVEVAKNLKKLGLSISQIIEATGLSEEEIRLL